MLASYLCTSSTTFLSFCHRCNTINISVELLGGACVRICCLQYIEVLPQFELRPVMWMDRPWPTVYYSVTLHLDICADWPLLRFYNPFFLFISIFLRHKNTCVLSSLDVNWLCVPVFPERGRATLNAFQSHNQCIYDVQLHPLDLFACLECVN